MKRDFTTSVSASKTYQQANRYFYVAAASLLIIMMFWGFHHFYFQGRAYPGRELAPPIKTLVIIHGITMCGWLLILITQSLFITNKKYQFHRTLGSISAVIAAAMVVLGLGLTIASLSLYPDDMVIWGLNPRQFLAVPVLSILIFGGLVTAGVLHRGRPGVHPNLMLLATLAAMAAAVSRIDQISALYQGTIWEKLFGPFFGTLMVALFFLVLKYVVTKSLDRFYAIGCAGLVMASAMTMALARTSVWEAIAAYLIN